MKTGFRQLHAKGNVDPTGHLTDVENHLRRM